MLEKSVSYQSLFVTNVHWNASSLLFVWSDYLWSSLCIFPVFIWETLTQIRIKEQSIFFLDLVLVNWPMKLINMRLSNKVMATHKEALDMGPWRWSSFS